LNQWVEFYAKGLIYGDSLEDTGAWWGQSIKRKGKIVTPRGAACGAATSNANPLHFKQRSKASSPSTAA
jgi:hypothetical protein